MRNSAIVLVGLIVGIAAIYQWPKPISRIKCSPLVREGQIFYCAATLTYPPNAPSYRWTTDGECTLEQNTGESSTRETGQMVQLSVPPRVQQHICVVHVAVYDRSGQHLLGTSTEAVSIQRSDAIEPPITVPEQPKITAASPST